MTDSSSLNPGDRPSLDILNLADCDRSLLRWMTRQKQVKLAEVVAYLNQEETEVKRRLDSLIQQGLIQVDGEPEAPCYRAQQAPQTRSRLSSKIWQQLDE
ncbi:MAG: ArsR family transcriptional regulator [Desertifilum sp. SIO1I2]|nr:ArsR family transcriptional regulator [Desertifilum sp. SIO1I2]